MFGCQRSFLYFPDKTALEPGQPGVQVVKLLSETVPGEFLLCPQIALIS
jgi:hypothetical protein